MKAGSYLKAYSWNYNLIGSLRRETGFHGTKDTVPQPPFVMTDEVFIGTVNESHKPFIKQVDTVKELSCSRANVFACLSGSLAIPAVVSLEVTSCSSTFFLSYVFLDF